MSAADVSDSVGYLWFFEVGGSHSPVAERFAIRDNGDFIELVVGDGTTLLKRYQRMFKRQWVDVLGGSVILTG